VSVVSVCVCALKEKRLELLAPRSVDRPYMTAASCAKKVRSKGQRSSRSRAYEKVATRALLVKCADAAGVQGPGGTARRQDCACF